MTLKALSSPVWEEQKGKFYVSFEIRECVKVGQYTMPLPNGKKTLHRVEISQEIKEKKDKIAASKLINEYLTEKGIDTCCNGNKEKYTIQ